MKNAKGMTLVALTAMMLTSPAFAEHHEGNGSEGKGKHWEKVDTDGDGFISEDEFLARHKEVFKELDKDSDGKLSKEEMKEGMKQRREKMMEHKTKLDDAESSSEPKEGLEAAPKKEDAPPAE